MFKPLLKFCLVGVGGFFGAGARYLVGGWVAQRLGTGFPWGTLVINLSGSFLLGLVFTLLSERYIGHPGWRLLVPIGFIGAYTTFSTFELETFQLLSQGSILFALVNVLASVLAGFLALWLGIVIGRAF